MFESGFEVFQIAKSESFSGKIKMKTSDFEIVSTDAENDQFNDLKLDFDPNLMELSFQSSVSFTQSYTQVYKLIGQRYSNSDASSDSIIADEDIGMSNKEVSIIIFHKKMISVPPVRGLYAHCQNSFLLDVIGNSNVGDIVMLATFFVMLVIFSMY